MQSRLFISDKHWWILPSILLCRVQGIQIPVQSVQANQLKETRETAQGGYVKLGEQVSLGNVVQWKGQWFWSHLEVLRDLTSLNLFSHL